jgi:hypothetical protein
MKAISLRLALLFGFAAALVGPTHFGQADTASRCGAPHSTFERCTREPLVLGLLRLPGATGDAAAAIGADRIGQRLGIGQGAAPKKLLLAQYGQFEGFPDLCPLPPEIANTFRSGTCRKRITQQPIILYRSWGGSSGAIGSYWTRSPPRGPLQAVIDCALDQNWGNTATNLTKIRVPAGITIFEGFAAPQGGLVGGCNQVFLPTKIHPSWIVR